MKNIPHQFNSIDKYFSALETVKQLIEEETPLRDENLGEQLLRNGVINPGRVGQSIEEYLEEQSQKTPSNRGYHTAARETIKFFKLIGFLVVYDNKSGELTPRAIQLLSLNNPNARKLLWRDSFMQFGVEGVDGEISHPYRILLKLTQDKPGIETSKLMLALEAENDSQEEYERILALSELELQSILEEINISEHQARNAVKILPSFAVQLGDIRKQGNYTYPIGHISITEDEISTEIPDEVTTEEGIPYSQYRQVTSENIARDPIFNEISSVSIDLTESIRIRQNRLSEHQEIVRQLALFCEQNGFQLFEGKFDCLSTLEDSAIVFEVKTILPSMSDQEKQTVKGVGQLKYYKFSIIQRQMGFENIREILVYSQKPNDSLIEFCLSENLSTVWLDEGTFKVYNPEDNLVIDFEPLNFI